MGEHHRHQDPDLLAILRGDHYHETPRADLQATTADWWAMITAWVGEGEHVLHLIPSEEDGEDYDDEHMLHAIFTVEPQGVAALTNEMHNWLHVLPLEMTYRGPVVVVLSAHGAEPDGGDRVEERIWIMTRREGCVALSAYEAEHFVRETEEAGSAEVYGPESVAEFDILNAYELDFADIDLPVDPDNPFRDAWVLEVFLDSSTAATNKSRYEFKRYVGPAEQYDLLPIVDRPRIKKTKRDDTAEST